MLRNVIGQVAKIWFLSLAVALAALYADVASAGVIITDGKAPGSQRYDDKSQAKASDLGQERPLTDTEQQLWLFAAMVLKGHDAASGSSHDATSDTEGDNDAGHSFDGGEGYVEWQPGAESCSSGAPSVLAGLLALALRRRKRT